MPVWGSTARAAQPERNRDDEYNVLQQYLLDDCDAALWRVNSALAPEPDLHLMLLFPRCASEELRVQFRGNLAILVV